MSNRSQVTAGFVKTVARTLPEKERCKKKQPRKMGTAFNIQKHGKCKRKGVCLVYMAKEHEEIMCIPRQRVAI